MIKCWASVLGDCDSQSREHYVSRGLWTNEVLTVVVPSWNGGRPTQIHLNSLFSKILCEKHNKALSNLDREAKKYFKAIGSIISDVEQKQTLRRSSIWSPLRFDVNGVFLERWLFKLAIGIISVLKKENLWALSGSPSGVPPRRLVRMVFGLEEIPKPFGVYSMLQIGKNPDFMEEVTFAPYTNDKDEYIAAAISIRTIPFLIWMDDSPIDEKFETLDGNFLSSEKIKQRYHHQEVTFTTKGKVVSRLKFNWN